VLLPLLALLGGCFAPPPHAPRAGGQLHEGNDIFAPRGTWNVAAADGRIRFSQGARQGNGLWLTAWDGTQYFYAHLDAYWGDERDVVAGALIGFLGNTGDAQFTEPHTHFEIHPNGGPAVNPYPTLVASCPHRVAASGAGDGGITTHADGFPGAAEAGVPMPG
jgi:peptidoglycan LD-endopeptidase LytH